jgi:hypothetical protein
MDFGVRARSWEYVGGFSRLRQSHMQPQYMRALADKSAADGEPGSAIRFIASTENVARDGMSIDSNGWDLDNFRANPVFLANHDYSGVRPPIGRVVDIRPEGGQLIADVVFDQADEYARTIERKYRTGFMNAVSVGWNTKEVAPRSGSKAPIITKAELLDLSSVNMPGDPGALIQRQLRALQEALEPTESTDANPDPARATWDETAASMVRLIVSSAQRPETERVTEYRALAREYARHGKTAPELLDAEVVAALGADQLRGLFLNGEPDLFPNTFALSELDTRAGAVLSKRNADDIDTAIAALQRIKERSSKEAETPEPDPEPTDDTLERLYAVFTKG